MVSSSRTWAEHRHEGRPVGAGPGGVVGEPPVGLAGQGVADGDDLAFGVLVGGGDADVADDLSGHV